MVEGPGKERGGGVGKERGGGVGILLKSTLSPTQISSKKFCSFEHTVVKLPCADNSHIMLISIYRLYSNLCISRRICRTTGIVYCVT